MSGDSINSIILGIILIFVFCSLCSCCYVSCVFGSLFTGVKSLVSYAKSKSSTTEQDIIINPVEKKIINNPEQKYIYPEQKYIYPEQEYINPTPEYIYPEQEYINPTPEYIYPEQEYINPTPEYIYPEQEYIYPEQEYIYPEQKYINQTPSVLQPVHHIIPPIDTSQVSNHLYLITNGANSMQPGDYILSPNKLYKLTFQTDGDLVLYDLTSPSGTPISIWSSKTMNTGADKVTLTFGGWLIITRGSTVIWSLFYPSTIRRVTFFKLVLQDDRNIVIYDSNNRALWTSNTGLSEPELDNPPVNNTAE